jgi:pimeloyl-ACP methyl ester carboxylesterase
MTGMKIKVEGADLKVTSGGSGAPLLVVQTALAIDELVPVTQEPALRDRFRIITFDRRGYGASGTGPEPGSVAIDARDCFAVLTALDALPAHVVGASYSAAVALDLAATFPSAVLTVTAAEPPPVHIPDGPEFLAANARLLTIYERDGMATALDAFFTLLADPNWRSRQERLAPGSVAHIERDADMFFRRDIPAIMAWHFGRKQAGQVTAPVMYVGGTESGPWFAQTRAWMASLFPAMRSLSIEGAGHDLALTHPRVFARGIAEFVTANTASKT